MSGKIYVASQKTPNVTTGPSGSAMPWVDPWVLNQAFATGGAGKMLHSALEASRGSMGLGNKI